MVLTFQGSRPCCQDAPDGAHSSTSGAELEGPELDMESCLL